MFARVMRFYGMSFDDLLNLTIKRFWFLNNALERIHAEEAIRQMKILGAVTSAESYKEAIESYYLVVGKVWVVEPDKTVSPQLDLDESAPDPEYERDKVRALKFAFATQ